MKEAKKHRIIIENNINLELMFKDSLCGYELTWVKETETFGWENLMEMIMEQTETF